MGSLVGALLAGALLDGLRPWCLDKDGPASDSAMPELRCVLELVTSSILPKSRSGMMVLKRLQADQRLAMDILEEFAYLSRSSIAL